MKAFQGKRDNDDLSTARLYLADGDSVKEIDPARSQKVYNHSPSGFNWGYGGSGPAQLALAILLEVCNDETAAQMFYQEFKWQFIATLPDNEWTIPFDAIDEWITEQVTRSIAG